MLRLPLRPLLAVAALIAATTSASAIAPEDVLKRVQDKLTAIATDPLVVTAVQEQNARGQTLAQVRAVDEAWIASPGITPLMRQLIDSPVAQRLRGLRKTMPFLAECFVMDQLGANVAMTEKTSDYWQGDEAKFIECVKNGGQTWVGQLAFDESTQTYSVQISLPIRSGDQVIGAICFGIDVETL